MRIRNRAPVWPFALAADSPHARGAVLVSPMLRGLPPLDLITGSVFAWTGTVPEYTVPSSVEGQGPIHATTIDGNGSGYVSTGSAYALGGVNTLTVEWWMNESNEYLSLDLDRWIASTRRAGNAGWSVGRADAAAGPPGNATRPQLVIQGVAAYVAPTYNIPARKWVHCAAVLNGTALRLLVNGAVVHTATTGSMSTGGTLLLLGQGPSGGNPWVNDVHSIVVRNVPLTDDEVALRADPAATWDLYYELGRRTYFIPAAAGGGGGFQSAWARNTNTVIQAVA